MKIIFGLSVLLYVVLFELLNVRSLPPLVLLVSHFQARLFLALEASSFMLLPFPMLD